MHDELRKRFVEIVSVFGKLSAGAIIGLVTLATVETTLIQAGASSIPTALLTFLSTLFGNLVATPIIQRLLDAEIEGKELPSDVLDALEKIAVFIEKSPSRDEIKTYLSRYDALSGAIGTALQIHENNTVERICNALERYTWLIDKDLPTNLKSLIHESTEGLARKEDIAGLGDAVARMEALVLAIYQHVPQNSWNNRAIGQGAVDTLFNISGFTPFAASSDLFCQSTLPYTEDFVGRLELIQEILVAADQFPVISIVGISGIGKTALLGQIAARVQQPVFVYEFLSGISSVDHLLWCLARFIDSQQTPSEGLYEVFHRSHLPLHHQIDLVVRELGKTNAFLFFDTAHCMNSNESIISFFKRLKTSLSKRIFVAGSERPMFYDAVDLAQGLVKEVHLDELEEADILEFFERKRVNLPQEMLRQVRHHLGGLPLTLDLLVAALSDTDDTEQNFLRLVDQIEGSIFDRLFGEIYERLSSDEKGLLTTAALFNFPFDETTLLSAYRDLFKNSDTHITFHHLQRRALVKSFDSSEYYRVHEAIRLMILKDVVDLSSRRMQLADYLTQRTVSDPGTDTPENSFEALWLYFKAKAYNQAARLADRLVESYMLTFEPTLSDQILNLFNEDMVLPVEWMRLTAAKGHNALFWQRYNDAEAYYKTALQQATILGDKENASVVLRCLGNVELNGDLEKAEQY